MPAILVFILGTGTGVALKYLWDKYKNFEYSQREEPFSTPIIPIGTENDKETPFVDTDKFYLQSVYSLFNKYNVNINEMDSLGILCNKIERSIKIELLELLTNQETIQLLLHSYQTESIKPFQVSFNFANSGAFVSRDYLTDIIKNLGLSINANSNSEQKVELILNAYYAKGIEAIFSNFGKEFEKLEFLNATNDSALESFYNTLKDDLAFHLKLLKK